jgi:hypothetical protein
MLAWYHPLNFTYSTSMSGTAIARADENHRLSDRIVTNSNPFNERMKQHQQQAGATITQTKWGISANPQVVQICRLTRDSFSASDTSRSSLCLSKPRNRFQPFGPSEAQRRRRQPQKTRQPVDWITWYTGEVNWPTMRALWLMTLKSFSTESSSIVEFIDLSNRASNVWRQLPRFIVVAVVSSMRSASSVTNRGQLKTFNGMLCKHYTLLMSQSEINFQRLSIFFYLELTFGYIKPDENRFLRSDVIWSNTVSVVCPLYNQPEIRTWSGLINLLCKCLALYPYSFQYCTIQPRYASVSFSFIVLCMHSKFIC